MWPGYKLIKMNSGLPDYSYYLLHLPLPLPLPVSLSVSCNHFAWLCQRLSLYCISQARKSFEQTHTRGKNMKSAKGNSHEKPIRTLSEMLNWQSLSKTPLRGRGALPPAILRRFQLFAGDFISIFFSRFCFWYFPCRKGASGRVLRNGWLFILGYL